MELWDEILTPAEVTATSRGIVDALEEADLTQRLLPNEPASDIRVEFEVETSDGRRTEGTPIRAWDTEAAIGGGAGGERRFAEVVPAAWKVRFSEYERLRRLNRTDPDSVAAAAESRQEETISVIVNRLRRLRSEALLTGKLAINERKVKQNVDFGRRPDFTATAAVMWDQANADWLSDYETWLNAYNEENGDLPSVSVFSRRAVAAILRSDQTKALFPNDRPTVAGVNEYLDEQGWPQIVVNSDLMALSQTHVLLATPGVNALGSTLWGPTAESQDERYGLADADQPGLVTGLYRTVDPIAWWVHSAASYMPLLKNANLSFAARVLPDA